MWTTGQFAFWVALAFIAGGFLGLILAALLGAAGREARQEEWLEAYDKGYAFAMERLARLHDAKQETKP